MFVQTAMTETTSTGPVKLHWPGDRLYWDEVTIGGVQPAIDAMSEYSYHDCIGIWMIQIGNILENEREHAHVHILSTILGVT